METVIVLGILVLVLGAVIRYLIRVKKRGVKCIGCPDGPKCSGSCSGCSGNCCSSR